MSNILDLGYENNNDENLYYEERKDQNKNIYNQIKKDKYDYSYNYNENLNLFQEYRLCGIKNYGANCYLNSGLQIIARCDSFIDWLNNSDYPNANCPFLNMIKKTVNILLNKYYFDPKDFIEYFSNKNSEFQIDKQNCSQLFIRNVFSNINEEIKNCMLKIENKKYHKDIVPRIKGYLPEGHEYISYSSFLIKYFLNQFHILIFQEL